MRKLYALVLFASLALAQNVTVSAPVKNVTLYSNGFAFVARQGAVSGLSGPATLHLVNFTRSAVPCSITPIFSAQGAKVTEHYYYSLSWNESVNTTEYFTLERLLNDSISKTVSFVSGNDSVEGTLKWYGNGLLGVSSGNGVAIYRISDLQRVTLPVSNYSEVIQENTTKHESGLAISTSGAGSPGTLSLSYLASGADWSASYKYYITSEGDAGSGTLQARASVTNGAGEDWENVSLKLVVGNPRIQSYYSPFRFYDADNMAKAAGAAPSPAESSFNDFTPTQVSAYYVYTLAGPATIRSGEERVLPLLENNISYKREYFWDTYSMMPEKAFIINNTGGEAWAAGVFSVYLNGEFLGEASPGYTPRGKEARVVVADMPDIKVKKETLNQSSTATDNSRTTIYEIKLTIENAAGEEVKLRVNDHMNYGDRVTLIRSSVPAEEKADNVLEWKPSIAAGGTLEITYEYSVTNYFEDRFF